VTENAGMAETIPGQRRMGRLAQALSELGSYAEAEAVLRRVVQMVEVRLLTPCVPNPHQRGHGTLQQVAARCHTGSWGVCG
jgi:hypothetical protein